MGRHIIKTETELQFELGSVSLLIHKSHDFIFRAINQKTNNWVYNTIMGTMDAVICWGDPVSNSLITTRELIASPCISEN